MKQLNFKHFNTNRKKLTVTVNVSHKETKTAPKGPILIILFGIPRSFQPFSDDSRSFQKISEDYRRFLNTAKDFRGEIRKFSTIFRRYTHVKDIVFTV